MKIVIIGGGGFVGSWLTSELISRGHKVVVVDPFVYYSKPDQPRERIINNFKRKILLKGAKIYSKKFEDGGDKVIQRQKPEIVIHLAGIPLEKMDNYKLSLSQLKDDIGLTYKVIKAVKDHSVGKFVFMSSISAYGDCDEIVTENFPLNPSTPYGISKASGEFISKSQLDNWNIVRTTNIYGFGDLNDRASNIILNKVLKGEKFWINKGIVMDFINVKDLAKGIADVALKGPSNEVFHISGGKAVGLVEYVKNLEKYFKLDFVVKDLADRPKRGTMNNQKARKLIGWSPKLSITEGIKDYINYVKKYKIA